MTGLLHQEIKETKNKLLQTASLFNEKQINTSPSNGSWTAGQILEHLVKAVSPEILYGTVRNTNRRPDEKVKLIRNVFLNYDTKMVSPDMILPSAPPHSKKDLIPEIENKFTILIEASGSLGLSKTCIDFTIPEYGQFTRLEWIYFFIYHIQRHTAQLKRVVQLIKAEEDSL